MASCSSKLSAATLSKVTDIVSAENSLRFCVEYLGIDRNEYKTIQHNARYSHHDTLFECLERWKNSTDGNGARTKVKLYAMLKTIQETHRWFSMDQLKFLADQLSGIISESGE